MAFLYPSRPMIAENDVDGERLVKRYYYREIAMCVVAFVGVPLALMAFLAWAGYALFNYANSQGDIGPYAGIALSLIFISGPIYYLVVAVIRTIKLTNEEIRNRHKFVKNQLRPIDQTHQFESLASSKGKLPVIDNFIEAIELEGRKPTVFELKSIENCLSKIGHKNCKI